MVLSIVIPTLGRSKEVEALLESVHKYVVPSGISFEVIVVDQNFSDLLGPVLERFREVGLSIEHHLVSFRGLSRAKNYGAKCASGEYVCFVDDDAEFTNGLVERAIRRLEEGKYDIVSGRCVDRDGKDSVLSFEHEECVLSLDSFENRFVESTMFFRRELLSHFSYDEKMGLGAFYGAEEGYDLVYRMLQENVRILFDPEICFYHPQTVLDHSTPEMARKAFVYRTGYGYLCRKHKLRGKYLKRFFSVLFYIPFLCIFRPKDVRYYVGELLGLLVGRIL